MSIADEEFLVHRNILGRHEILPAIGIRHDSNVWTAGVVEPASHQIHYTFITDTKTVCCKYLHDSSFHRGELGPISDPRLWEAVQLLICSLIV